MKTFLFLMLFAFFTGQSYAQMPCNPSFTSSISPSGAVTFAGTPGSPTNTYTWDFGNGTTGWGIDVTAFYNTPGTYTVCLVVQDSLSAFPCIDTNCMTITIGTVSACQAGFTAFNTGGSTMIYGVTNTSVGTGLSYTWNWGDGSPVVTGANPSPHTYAASGTYTICLIVDDGAGCTDTACQMITISATGSCQAMFTLTPNNSPTALPYTYDANNTSIGTGLSYVWSWGDGSPNTTIANPSHVFPGPGTYNVCLTVSDGSGCIDTSCTPITVSSVVLCSASFYIYQDTMPGAPASTYIGINTSTGAGLNYLWLWGDGTTSTGAYPSHTYAAPGNYQICLVVTSPGCVDSFCALYLINKTSAMYTVSFQAPSSVSSYTQKEVTIYPNPADDKLFVQGNANEWYNISIYSINGSKVLQTNARGNDAISVKQLASGMYMIKVSDQDGFSRPARFQKN